MSFYCMLTIFGCGSFNCISSAQCGGLRVVCIVGSDVFHLDNILSILCFLHHALASSTITTWTLKQILGLLAEWGGSKYCWKTSIPIKLVSRGKNVVLSVSCRRLCWLGTWGKKEKTVNQQQQMTNLPKIITVESWHKTRKAQYIASL